MAIRKDESDTEISQQSNGLDGSGEFTLRPAYASDTNAILELINGYAAENLMLQRGPKYLYESIRDFVVVEAKAENGSPKVVACGSIHVLWEDIAEIRSVAVDQDYQHRGFGSEIVRYLIKEAQKIKIDKVFAFTLEQEFFIKLGFKLKEEQALPSKVWDECVHCPKYFQCDETGLIFDTSR